MVLQGFGHYENNMEKRRENKKTPEDDRKNWRQVSATFGQKPIKLNTD